VSGIPVLIGYPVNDVMTFPAKFPMRKALATCRRHKFKCDSLHRHKAPLSFYFKIPIFSLALKNSSSPPTSSPIVYITLTGKNRECPNNTNALSTINGSNNFTITNDRSNLLTWLSPLDAKLRHEGIRDHRVETVGQWLLRTQEYRRWYKGSGESESDKPVLFCYGNPGVGKTFIR